LERGFFILVMIKNLSDGLYNGHHPSEVIKGFVEAKELLGKLGFKEVMQYKEGCFVPVGL